MLDKSQLINTVSAARYLLGKLLVHEYNGQRLSGIIVETEAYSQDDPAAHSFTGNTVRTAAMFGAAGHAYVYRSYGLHWCMNVTTGEVGHGSAVLIRALQPVDGIEIMRQFRKKEKDVELCNGPGKLTQALGITGVNYGHDLAQPPLYIENQPAIADDNVIVAPRIGITKNADALLRFYIKNSPYISKL